MWRPTSARGRAMNRAVVTLYQAGRARKQIAHELGISTHHVRAHLYAAGIVERPRAALRTIAAELRRGDTIAAIERRYGYARGNVSHRVNRLGGREAVITEYHA